MDNTKSTQTQTKSTQTKSTQINQSTQTEIHPPSYYRANAIDYDYYEEDDDEGPYKTREQKLQRLKELDNQKYCPWSFEQVYFNDKKE